MRIINNISDLSNVLLQNDTIYQLGELTEQMTITDIVDPVDTTIPNMISILFSSTVETPLVISTDKINSSSINLQANVPYELSLLYDNNTSAWDLALIGNKLGDSVIDFTASSELEDIESSDTLSKILGKLKRWYSNVIGKVGDISTLTTTNKTIVGGINEMNEFPHIIESSYNSNGFYTKYSNGLIEQYGTTTANTDGYSTFTYPIPLISIHTFVASPYYEGSAGGSYTYTLSMQNSQGNKSANIYIRQQNGDAPLTGVKIYWYLKGIWK